MREKGKYGKGEKAVIRVLVAEDHTIVRDGLVALIRQQADMDVVADAGDGQQAVDLWKKHRPDITLMDLKMPGTDGVAAIEKIRALDPNARIIVLTTYSGDEDIYRGIRAGAKAYLLKDMRREDLFRCIHQVHAGGTLIPSEIAAKLAERLPAEELTPPGAGGPPAPVSRQAQQVDRRRTCNHGGHRQEPRPISLPQAERSEPHRGHRGRHPQRAAAVLTPPPKVGQGTPTIVQ